MRPNVNGENKRILAHHPALLVNGVVFACAE
jgi:hypothetical protein